MRYWIWWNDLIQGPFEPDELTSLKAFSEDLLVCMEDREDWLPASRVADLSSAIEQLRARQAPPRVPPPSPPRRPPTVTPLQGEFFTDPPGQEPLIEPGDGPKGPFAYRPVLIDSDRVSWGHLEGRVTNPFHFFHPPAANTAVIEMPRPEPVRVTVAPTPVIKESPIPKEDLPPVVPLRWLKEEVLEEPGKSETPPAWRVIPALDSPYEEASGEKKIAWLPWVVGLALAITALGSLGYWLTLEPAKPMALAIKGPVPTAGKVPGSSWVPGKVVKYAAAKYKHAASTAKRRFAAHRAGQPKASPAGERAPALPGLAPSADLALTPHPAPAVAQTPPAAETAPAAPPAETAPPAPTAAEAQASANSALPAPDPWKGKPNEAINLVQNKTLPKSKITIGYQARALLQEMHEKELIHAAETGERLYLPDKMTWTALQEDGSHYRVYLNFMAMQANGERVQTRSYQFLVDLKAKDVRAADASTEADLFTQPAELTFKHNPMATDIDSILGGVDTYNKHKVQLIIVKKNSRNREERKRIEARLAAAQDKMKRAVIYFRRTYPETALQNVAKAYAFTELLKG